jgi:hypothetical protein
LVIPAIRQIEREQQQEQVPAENNENLSLHEPKAFSVFANFDALTASLQFKCKVLKIVIGYFIFYFFKIKGPSVAIIELYFI